MQLDQSNNPIHEPSEVVSRYLEAIYYMWSEREPLRSARLADWLGVSRPTVAVGLRRMTRDGLVRMNRRKEIELTPAGMRATGRPRKIVPPAKAPRRTAVAWLMVVLSDDA